MRHFTHIKLADGRVWTKSDGIASLAVSEEFVRSYNAQAHEIIDAVSAAVINARAGLNWLRAQPPDSKEVQEALNSIVNEGKRAAELVLRAYDAHAHEIADAVAAVAFGAQAGLKWLRAQPPDLEEVRRALDRIVKDGKRAAEIVGGLRALVNECTHSG